MDDTAPSPNADVTKPNQQNVAKSETALWLRDPHCITKPEYYEMFYGLSPSKKPPFGFIHERVAGLENSTLLIYAARKYDSERPCGGFVSLCQNGKFIKYIYLETYLSFIHGVIDVSPFPQLINGESTMPSVEEFEAEIAKKISNNSYDLVTNILRGEFAHEFDEMYRDNLRKAVSFDMKWLNSVKFPTSNGWLSIPEFAQINPDQIIHNLRGESMEELLISPLYKHIRLEGVECVFIVNSSDDKFMDEIKSSQGRRLEQLHLTHPLCGYKANNRPITDWMSVDELQYTAQIGEIAEKSNLLGLYTHATVVLKEKYTVTGPMVIDLTISPEKWMTKVGFRLGLPGVVDQRKLSKAINGRSCRIANRYDEVLVPKSKKRIAKNAESKIGTHAYGLFTENCDMFACWARYGYKRSYQVDRVKKFLSGGML